MPEQSATSYVFQERMKCMEKVNQILEPLPRYCLDFLYHKVNGPKKMQPRTALAYAGDYSTFFYFLSVRNPLCKDIPSADITPEFLGNLTRDDIEEYYEFLHQYERNGKIYTNEGSSQKRKINSLSSLYKYLISKEYITNNPCLLIDTDRLKNKPIVALAPDQQNRLLDEVELSPHETSKRALSIKKEYTRDRDLAILYLFLGTGLRASELVGLNIDDIDLIYNTVLITRKGGKLAQLAIGDEVAGAIRDYVEQIRPKLLPEIGSKYELDRSALFLSIHHRRIGVRQIENIVKKASEQALGENNAISPHKLRSTFATQLLKNSGGDISLVAEQLGHEDINTTRRRYSKVQNLRDVPNYVEIRKYNPENSDENSNM